MSLILARKAPLRVGYGWKAEVVASRHGWHLAVTCSRPEAGRWLGIVSFDIRACLGLLLALKRAWGKVCFHRNVKKTSPGTIIKGLYSSSEMPAIGVDIFGDYVQVFGLKLRTQRQLNRFRASLLSSLRLGQRFHRSIRKNSSALVQE